MLNIDKKVDGTNAIFKLGGRLDTNTATELEASLKPDLDNLTELVFDFADLEYISSAGLRVLLASHKNVSKRGTVKIRNANETIMEIFEVTGFSDILNIE